MAKLNVQIITPEKIVFTQDVDMITIPGTEGELGILPHHIPLFTKIKPGEMKIKNGTEEYFVAVTGGFANISGEKVTILADYAIRAEDIEEHKVEEAKKRAEETLRDKKSETNYAIAEADLRRALLELKVATHRKNRRNG